MIVSHELRAERKPTVEILLCTSMRQGQAPAPHEVILNGADGLDWATVCRCDLIYSVPKAQLTQLRGMVSIARRRDIVRKIMASHGWV